MRILIFLAMVLACIPFTTLAQHGTAENGYYPAGYHGDIFSGNVTAVNDDTREVTLAYTDPRNHKTETFIGVLQQGYTVRLKDNTTRPLGPSNIPIGKHLTVYYTTEHKKVNGKKTAIHTIFSIKEAPNATRGYFLFMPFKP